MRAEGTRFVTGVEVGGSADGDLSAEQLRGDFDAVVLAGGATVGRDLPAPGRELSGIHLAMEYLPYGNLQALGELDDPPINAHGKHVVIIGGGDTGADCLGTAHRQGAPSVTQLEIMPAPPDRRDSGRQPVADLPDDHARLQRARGGRRAALLGQHRALPGSRGRSGRGRVRALLLHEVERVDGRFQKVEGTERELPADLVLPGHGLHRCRSARGCSTPSASRSTGAATSPATREFMSTVPGVFVAGDIGRGQSLIVWAIAEGRAAAAGVDTWLTGDSGCRDRSTPTDGRAALTDIGGGPTRAPASPSVCRRPPH